MLAIEFDGAALNSNTRQQLSKKTFLCTSALTFIIALMIEPALAGPTGGTITAGGGAIDIGATATTVSTHSDRTIIDWSSFSIDAAETASFVQPSAGSAVLNRVTGESLSDIQGTLRSNGEVFLLNPNGVLIGADAVIDTAGFVTSTLSVEADDFLNGDDLVFTGASDAAIRNLGEVVARRGDVVMIARNIENNGSLSAPEGHVALAAGSEVLLAHKGEQRIFVRAPIAGDIRIDNTGAIEAARAEIAAHGGNIYSLAINNEGLIHGRAVEVGESGSVRITAAGGAPDRSEINLGGEITASTLSDGGEIRIDAGADGTVWSDGRITATGARGGDVSITGRRVALTDNAVVDASGARAGGRVRIGGGLQGEDADLRNAEQTWVGEDVNIAASAIDNGAGGEAIVWADNATQFYGHVDVSGGANGGDGGFTEVSGKQYLDFQGTAELSARAGFTSGEILLDPTDITIASGLGDDTPGADQDPLTAPFDISFATDTSIIEVTTLEGLLASGDVTITTNGPGNAPGGGDITIDTTITVANGRRLTLIADDDIISSVALPFNIGVAGGTAFLTLEAGGDVGSAAQRISMETVTTPNNSSIMATGENVYLEFLGPITMEDITATNGVVDIRNVSDSNNPFWQTGDVIATGNIRIDSSLNIPGNQGHFMDPVANPVIRSTGGGDIDIITAGAGGILITRVETAGRVSISNSTNIAFITDNRSDPSGPPNIQAGALDITGFFRSLGTQIDIDTPQLNIDITNIGPNASIMAFENSFAGDVTLTNYTGAANVNYRQTGGGALNITGPVSTSTSFVGGIDPSDNPGDIMIATDGDINIGAGIDALDEISFAAGGAININSAISATNGGVSLAAVGRVDISAGVSAGGNVTVNSDAGIALNNHATNALDLSATGDISFTTAGDIDIRGSFSAGGTALFDADGDVLLVGLASEIIDAETTINAGNDIRYDGLIAIRQPLDLIAAGSVFRIDESVFGNSFFGASGFAPDLDIQAGGDIGLPGDPLVSIVADTTLSGDNIFLRTDGAVRLNGVTAAGDFFFQNTPPVGPALPGQIGIFGDIVAGGNIRFDLTNTGDYSIVMDQTANPVIRSTGGGEIFFELADAGAHELTRLETDGAVAFRSSGLGINSLADASVGEAANIAAGSLTLDGFFTQVGVDDMDIAASEINITFTNAASSLVFENSIASDVVMTSYTGAAQINYTQSGGGALIANGPISASGDVAMTTDGDIRLTSLDAGGDATLNAAGSITDVSGVGLANITAANAFLSAGGDIGAAAAPITLAASIGILNATAGDGLFVDSLGALQVGTGAMATSAGGDINILAADDLTIANMAGTAGDIVLGSLNGAITSNVALSGDMVSLSAAGDIGSSASPIELAAAVNTIDASGANVFVSTFGEIEVLNGAASLGDFVLIHTGVGDLFVSGAIVAANNIRLTTDGDLRLTSLDAGGDATLNAAGSITDVSGGGLANITAANAFLSAGADIGAAAAPITLDASIGILSATAGDGLFVDSLGALQVGTGAMATSAGGDINILAADDLTIANMAGTAGDIVLGSLNGAITSNVALSGDMVSLSAAGDIGSSASPIELAAAVNTIDASGANVFVSTFGGIEVLNGAASLGDFVLIHTGVGDLFVSGAIVAANNIRLTTDGDLRLTSLDAGGDATLTSGGAIIDESVGETPQISAERVILNAVTGVGAGDDLDLAVQTIIVDNAGAGGVRLSNTTAADASATISTGAGNIDLRQSGGGDLSASGFSTLAGDIVVDVDGADLAASAMTARAGGGAAGDIVLGAGTPIDLNLAGAFVADGDVTVIARRDLRLDGANITAGGAVTLVSDSDAARPDIGPGEFSAIGDSAVTGSRVDIFSAQPNQFLIDGRLMINGVGITATLLSSEENGVAFERYFGDPQSPAGAEGYLLSFKGIASLGSREVEDVVDEILRAGSVFTEPKVTSTSDPLMLYDAGGKTSFGARISYADEQTSDDLSLALSFSSSYTLAPSRFISVNRPWLFPVQRQRRDLAAVLQQLNDINDNPIDIDAIILGDEVSCESVKRVVEIVDTKAAREKYIEICGALKTAPMTAPRTSPVSAWEVLR